MRKQSRRSAAEIDGIGLVSPAFFASFANIARQSLHVFVPRLLVGLRVRAKIAVEAFSYAKGDMKPVDSVSYEMIRGKYLGAQWPDSNNVDKDSFMGRLRSRTNISFDLPCTNMWICAATTVTPEQKYYWGNKKSTAFMWYYDNQNNAHSDRQKTVGEKIPNGYGLYDMLGNISEWCLDWSPRGENTRVCRAHCGGHYNSPDPTVLEQYRDIPSKQSAFVGFRVACPLMEK